MIVKKLSKGISVIEPPVSQKIKTGYIVLKKGEEVGEHITQNREEIIIVLEGRATIILESEIQEVKEDFVAFIPENKKHNVRNIYKEILKYVYVITPTI